MYIQSVEGLKFKVWTVWAFYFSLCAATSSTFERESLGEKLQNDFQLHTEKSSQTGLLVVIGIRLQFELFKKN